MGRQRGLIPSQKDLQPKKRKERASRLVTPGGQSPKGGTGGEGGKP